MRLRCGCARGGPFASLSKTRPSRPDELAAAGRSPIDYICFLPFFFAESSAATVFIDKHKSLHVQRRALQHQAWTDEVR